MNNPRLLPASVLSRAGRLLLMLLALTVAACQQAQPPAETAAPEAAKAAYYTCSMHPQIHANGPGSCPICHMDLIRVQPAPVAAPAAKKAASAAVYTCPMHPQVREAQPGSCPICGMDLVKTSSRPAVKMTPAEMAAMPGGNPAANDLILTAQQLELGNIRVQTIGNNSAGSEATGPAEAPAPQALLTGTVTADAQRTQSISSRVAGRVEKLYVRQTGQLLRRGAPLFSVYSEQLETLQREYLLALAQDLQVAEPTYRHFAEATAQKLRLLGVSAGQLRQLARSGKASPLVTYYSPATGTVQTLDVVQGQYVAEGSPLLTLSDLGSVWVEAQLYPADAGRLRLGQSVAVQVVGRARPLRGHVVFLSPELSGASQITLARIQVPNPDGTLQPGAQANVLLDAPAASAATTATAPTQTALRVPQEAIIHDGAASYVWKQTGERQFRRVQVRTSAGTAATVAITGEVRPGDQLVVSGAYLLQSEFTLRQGAGDDHMSGMAM
ncbi:efflux RND transporter periplasmic adaptor subunit [Hymenobacter negativus]|uniref:Efflux RND transporter periplasmic adaptor subunit n=1 Tax=Hymenobacter negativus TaxID=2795026 RepID=A0ABS0QCP7_9BACT|nr:efflux RND transporter periplasmic adaptor subunit [Hymenobacter negativus]MBH8560387.1 efflux RND transporter periplasmic adaptor subunit [Hymenobacter negativus]